MHKIDYVERCAHFIGDYRAELMKGDHTLYSSTYARLAKIAGELQEFINLVNDLTAARELSSVNECPSVKNDSNTPAECVCKNRASQEDKRSLYRAAISDWHRCLKQVAKNDELSEPARAIADIMLDWFEWRILKYCGKNKSSFRIRCSDIWRMLFVLGIAYTNSLCEDETGTTFMISYQQWKTAIATDSNARDTFALPYVAFANLRTYPTADVFTFGSDCMFIREILLGGLDEMKNIEKYSGYEIPSDWFRQLRSSG